MRSAIFVLALIVATPAIARADATAFLGRNSAGDDRSVTRGFAVGVSLLVVGFEFEYANSSEDQTDGASVTAHHDREPGPSDLRPAGFQLYATTGAGLYRERLGRMRNRTLLLNNGGGIKINVAGPVRARVDYRIFSLRGNPRHKTVQRIYAGLNLAF